MLEIDGESMTVYRENQGVLYAFSARCAPSGGNVESHGAAKTSDCPYHGGRYRTTGELPCAPSIQSLA
jgi:nitrite reductase/ring-hydroxylating ferredoxin subunit